MSFSPAVPVSPAGRGLSRRQQLNVERQQAALTMQTYLRVLAVQAEGLVQGAKLDEMDHLTRQAMTGQALLARWRDSLANGDPLLADEMNFFVGLARVGKAEVIADTISRFGR